MTFNADAMIDRTVAKEGNYSDHPADRGGPTKYGITEQVARSYGYNGSMKALPRSEALRIYKKRYWERPEFDKVAAIYPKVAEEMFDTGVNMGPAIAARFLQILLNVLNQKGRDYGDINVDDDVGPVTLHALRGYAAKRKAAGEAVLLKGLEALQGARYIEISQKNPSQEAFTYGWLANRIGL